VCRVTNPADQLGCTAQWCLTGGGGTQMPFWAKWTRIRSQNRPVRSHTRTVFPQTFVDDNSCLLGLNVFTPPEASRREEEHCGGSGRPSGQEVRFTKPCGTAVASVHKGMWRRPLLCGRPVACEDIPQQYGDKTRVLSYHAGPVERMARRDKEIFELSWAIISLVTKR